MKVNEYIKTKTDSRDAIDMLADDLPEERRAGFYRVIRHCRNLPENDEMLIVLNAMSYLTLFIDKAPREVKAEREKMEKICNTAIAVINQLSEAGSRYHKQLDSRLTTLPDDIAAGIDPMAIVERINANLKKQFHMSTIPIVAGELKVNATAIKTATNEYMKATAELCNSWRSASDKAHEAIRNIDNAVLSAAKSAEKAIKSFTVSFDKTYHCLVAILLATSLASGIMLGMMIIKNFK